MCVLSSVLGLSGFRGHPGVLTCVCVETDDWQINCKGPYFIFLYLHMEIRFTELWKKRFHINAEADLVGVFVVLIYHHITEAYLKRQLKMVV